MSDKKGNLTIERYFSQPYGDPYTDSKGMIKYSPRDVQIKDDDGNVIEEIKGAVFPEDWSQLAADTTATKYFRKEGVPDTGREIDLRQLMKRVGRTIRNWGIEQGYFNEKNAKNLEYEVAAATVGQYAAFNSPVWFNLGLNLYEGCLKGEEAKGMSYSFDFNSGKIRATTKFLGQASACFISSPKDSIKDMIKVGADVSAEIFRRGSGIGGNWSSVRSAGEPISGGGKASGAKRFMDVQDAVGRVIKSGGKTRRAATMQIIDVWHPDMLDIIRDKYAEEQKARILLEAGSPSEWESHTFQNLRGQNVNISVRIDDDFWKAYENNELYPIKFVKDKKIKEMVPARKLAKIIAYSAYGCGDPGIQHDTIINNWNTCKNSGRINASNPCSEYMFFDNSACNLASINLMRFRKSDGTFDSPSFSKAVDLYFTCQDILVSHASYPTKEIASNSHIYRPIGLGYANLGAYIMSLGLAYDSDEARNFSAAVTSLMTAEAALQSSRLAERLGPFQEFAKNKDCMLEVMNMHRKAARQIPRENGLEYLVDEANKKWDEVLRKGKEYGFRNAQFTLLAPTGTIGFMMDCDTTGCEPEYQLVKHKELAGGGSMTIVNQTVPLALKTLGYDEKTIEKIVGHVNENMDSGGKVKRGSVEGCLDLKPEHLSVFDCSVCSSYGERSISPMAHIKMLGAIQPHISGAISKTVNCPADTTVEEIENLFYQSWVHRIKAMTVYRDGSKASQPLKTGKANKLEILARGKRETLPKERNAKVRKVKVGGINLFITTGEYSDGRLGEIFVESLERGTEVNRLLNENAIQFSEKLQYGVPLEQALEIFQKAGRSQIEGMTDHEFIKMAKGPEGFIYDFLRTQYLGDISFLLSNEEARKVEMRPLPWELRCYQRVPKLHLMPTVEGEKMYPGVPSLEETIQKISGYNYWEDKEEGLDTRQTIEKIKRNRTWGKDEALKEFSGRITGRTCSKGHLMISDGKCFKCPICMIAEGCGGG